MKQSGRTERNQVEPITSQASINAYLAHAEAMKSKYRSIEPEQSVDQAALGSSTPYEEEKIAEQKDASEEDKKEKAFLVQLAIQREDLNEKTLKNAQLANNIDLRENFANKIFWFVVFSTAAVGLVVMGSGYKGFTEIPDGKSLELFTLSDQVLIALITAVTINVMAGLLVVMKNLFPVPVIKNEKN